MKKHKIALCAFVSVAALSVAAIVLTFYFAYLQKPAAERIYSDCIENIVEIKAEAESVGESFGTAEIVDQNGMLVTNAHVVTYSKLNVRYAFERFYIRFTDETDYREVELIRYDIEQDLAMLKIKDAGQRQLKPVRMGDSDMLTGGQQVYAVGNAVNYGVSISRGIVGIPLIEINYDDVARRVIQCDLHINAGSSGGALLDAEGRLVGITTFRTKDQSGGIIYGLAYCIPVNTVKAFLK